jgi:OFA family oxalate/formate antiporter-like MFS transporter
MSVKTKRWPVLLGTLTVVPCLGAVYAWSVFSKPVQKLFGNSMGVDPSTLTTSVGRIFSIVILMFAVSALIAGKLQDRLGPRWITFIGGVLLGGGLLLASTAKSVGQLQFYYGVVAGSGLGFGYVCPLATCVKWFPDKKGLITGVAVGGMGAGSTIFAPLSKWLIGIKGVMPTFAILGAIFFILISIGSQFLKNPPAGFKPAGWNPPPTSTAGKGANDFTMKQMLATPQFYLIWIMFLLGCTAALMFYGLASPIGQKIAGLSVAEATGVVAIIGLLNSGGRLLWGGISDKLGRMRTLSVVFTICALAMIMLMYATSYGLFLTAACLVALSLGGFMATFPATTADFYGPKNLGGNYGLVYLAYGFGAVVGIELGARYFKADNINTAFMVAAVLCLIGAGLALFTKAPHLKSNAESTAA